MNTLYGKYGECQLSDYREKLHSKMHWLLIYRDPKTIDDYSYVDFDKYFKSLMKEINGLNDILMQPPKLVEMMSLLQAAYNETTFDSFNYKTYRKFILDAHNVLDEIDFGGGQKNDYAE